jgi:hypothetical protein
MDGTTAAKIEITAPRRFNTGAVLAVSAYGILPALPIFAAILVVSVLKIGLGTLVVPFVALALSAVVLPFGFGNSFVTRLVRGVHPDAGKTPDSFIVQLTLSPRVRSGLRALVEDADDVGLLTFSGSELAFQGDSINLRIPLDQISKVQPQNIGWRGLYVLGRRIRVVAPGLSNVEWVEFAERSSWLLPSSRRTTKQLYQRLTNK